MYGIGQRFRHCCTEASRLSISATENSERLGATVLILYARWTPTGRPTAWAAGVSPSFRNRRRSGDDMQNILLIMHTGCKLLITNRVGLWRNVTERFWLSQRQDGDIIRHTGSVILEPISTIGLAILAFVPNLKYGLAGFIHSDGQEVQKFFNGSRDSDHRPNWGLFGPLAVTFEVRCFTNSEMSPLKVSEYCESQWYEKRQWFGCY